MKRAAGFQSGIKWDKLKACDTPTNPNEHMLADYQTWNMLPSERKDAVVGRSCSVRRHSEEALSKFPWPR